MSLPEEPLSRVEKYLSRIAGESGELPEPLSRIELYLAAMAGENVILPEEPLSRIEQYLAYIVEHGGGGGGGGGELVLLNSGTYTQQAEATSMTIPASYSGTPAIWLVSGGAKYQESSTHAWAGIADTFKPTEMGTVFSHVSAAKATSSSSVKTLDKGGDSRLESDQFVVNAIKTTYKIKAITFNWYVWGFR